VLQRMEKPAEAEKLVRKQLAQAQAWSATDEEALPIRVFLARSHENVGRVLQHTRRHTETADAFRDAATHWRRLVAEVPTNADYASKLGVALNDWALALHRQNRLQEMTPLLEEAIEAQERAVRARPTDPLYQQYLCNHYSLRAAVRVRLGEHAFVLPAASAVRERFAAQLDELLWASILARCIPLAEKDPSLGPDERARLAGEYAEQAISLLHGAQRKKKNLSAIHKLPDFAALLSRPDFQKFLATVPKPGK
jgi:tetratricopeptide (TPR) repeat protein